MKGLSRKLTVLNRINSLSSYEVRLSHKRRKTMCSQDSFIDEEHGRSLLHSMFKLYDQHLCNVSLDNATNGMSFQRIVSTLSSVEYNSENQSS